MVIENDDTPNDINKNDDSETSPQNEPPIVEAAIEPDVSIATHFPSAADLEARPHARASNMESADDEDSLAPYGRNKDGTPAKKRGRKIASGDDLFQRLDSVTPAPPRKNKLAIGLGLALLVNRRFRLRGLFRALLMLPWAMPAFVAFLAWRVLYQPIGGGFNLLLTASGLYPEIIDWLGQRSTAMPAVIAASVWRGFPFWFVSILAALQTIPGELYEAALVDGASAWQRFRAVTLPAIRPVVIITAVLSSIWTANSFENVWLLTQGGPSDATIVFPVLAYFGMQTQRLGEAAAVSVAMLPVLAILVFTGTGPWSETSLTLDLFGYHGLSRIDNGTSAAVPLVPEGQSDAINVVGGSGRFALGSLLATAGAQFENHTHPYAGAAAMPAMPGVPAASGVPDSTSARSFTQYDEIDYIVYPWLVPGVRAEYTHLGLEEGSANLLRLIPGVAFLVRPNIRAVLTATLERAHGVPPTGSWAPAGGYVVAPAGASSTLEAEQIKGSVAWSF